MSAKDQADRVKHIEKMRRFIQHREKVLDMQSVVKSATNRSKSVPSSRRNSLAQNEQQRKIERENQRLLQSLIRIANKPSPYGKKT